MGETLTAQRPPATVEDWATALLTASSPESALAMGAPPSECASHRSGAEPPPRPARLDGGHGPASRRSVRVSSLTHPRGRAELLATFAHHELQAAELMAWAALRFGEAPAAFRRGLVRIAAEELEHARALTARVRELGHAPDEFERRDLFWMRVPSVASPAEFCAVMGLGLEAANLEHAELWAARLRSAGDPRSAELQERIGAEEVAHVRFGRVWFERFLGPLEFERWRAQLPDPWSPTLLKGKRLARAARASAGIGEAFLDDLERF